MEIDSKVQHILLCLNTGPSTKAQPSRSSQKQALTQWKVKTKPKKKDGKSE